MNYASTCSGIEAATVAWDPLGWKPVWFSENEKFPSRVLAHHYPHVPNLGDMLKLTTNEIYQRTTFNLLVGGTPCQSFSIAGLRKGLKDDRGNLALEYCRILIQKQPPWFVWENVPGVLSSFSDEEGTAPVEGIGPEHGRDVTQTADFATLLSAFTECGYSCAWRVLDSQFFGVPQRRRRVFVVGHIGNDWRPPFTVLFEPEGMRRDIEKSRKKEKTVAALTASGVGTCGADDNQAQAGHLIPTIAGTLETGERGGGGTNPGIILPCWWDGGQTSQTLDAVLAKGQMMPEKNRFPVICFSANDSGNDAQEETAPTLRSGNHNKSHANGGIAPGVLYPIKSNSLFATGTKVLVRKLTPRECERLQGFPDNYTNIPGASDSGRYKALGNSMTTNVMRWIGKRINALL